jgi:hypothetical protein
MWKYSSRPPFIVVATNQGKDLRFYGPAAINPRGDNLYKFAETESWKEHPIWESSFGPGGSR